MHCNSRYITNWEAPSAKNRRPWRFSILTGNIKDKVANLMIEYEGNNKINNGIKYTAEVILQAAYLVLIFKNKDKDWDISDNLSIGACVENMILYATDIGIGSLWIRYTYCIQDEISEAFGNGGTELVCSVAFGIHAEIKENKSIRDIKSIAKWV